MLEDQKENIFSELKNEKNSLIDDKFDSNQKVVVELGQTYDQSEAKVKIENSLLFNSTGIPDLCEPSVSDQSKWNGNGMSETNTSGLIGDVSNINKSNHMNEYNNHPSDVNKYESNKQKFTKSGEFSYVKESNTSIRNSNKNDMSETNHICEDKTDKSIHIKSSLNKIENFDLIIDEKITPQIRKTNEKPKLNEKIKFFETNGSEKERQNVGHGVQEKMETPKPFSENLNLFKNIEINKPEDNSEKLQSPSNMKFFLKSKLENICKSKVKVQNQADKEGNDAFTLKDYVKNQKAGTYEPNSTSKVEDVYKLLKNEPTNVKTLVNKFKDESQMQNLKNDKLDIKERSFDFSSVKKMFQ